MWAEKRAGSSEKWRGHVMCQHGPAETEEIASPRPQKMNLHPCSFDRPQNEQEFSHGISTVTTSKAERSGIRCGTEKRPPHLSGVRSVTSRRIRSSNCWQDL